MNLFTGSDEGSQHAERPFGPSPLAGLSLNG